MSRFRSMSRFQKLLMAVLARLPHKDIRKGGVLYLRRHYLTPRSWSYRVFLHLIARPDDDRDPHDHPFPFWTVPLWAGYHEAVYETAAQLEGRQPPVVQEVRPLRLKRRGPEFVHMIVRLRGAFALTLVFAGPARRVWGFWTVQGFVPEDRYDKKEDL